MIFSFYISDNLMQKLSKRSKFLQLIHTIFGISASDICPNLLYLVSIILYQYSVQILLRIEWVETQLKKFSNVISIPMLCSSVKSSLFQVDTVDLYSNKELKEFVKALGLTLVNLKLWIQHYISNARTFIISPSLLTKKNHWGVKSYPS